MHSKSPNGRSDHIKALHVLEFLAFSSIRGLLGALPLSAACSMSAFCWRVLAPRLYRHRRAMENLTLAMPELSTSEKDHILIKMWDNLGRTFAESFRLSEIADRTDSLAYNFSEEARRIIEGDCQAIFVSLHAGNWEINAITAERFGKPIIGLYKKVANPLIDADVRAARKRFYTGGILSKSSNTVGSIRKAIGEGYSVAVMADLRDSHAEFAPFFGIPTRSTPFPALLARLYNLPIIAIRSTRTAPGQFRVDAECVALSSTDNRRNDIIENTARIQRLFEAWIRGAPELWMWGQRRWSSESLEILNSARIDDQVQK